MDLQGLNEIGVDLSSEQLQLLAEHLDFVLETNSSIRLTAIHDRDEAVRLHVVDSLLALPEVVASLEGPMLDIGTGGGYPGLPLAVATGRPVDLLDSVKKKTHAIQSFIDKNHMHEQEIAAIGERAEERALERPDYYSIVLARAVSLLPSLVELASPLLKDGGRLIAYKGAHDQDELNRGIAVAELVGMRYVSKREYLLPAGEESRTIYVFERCGISSVDLPRRPGRAQRKLLA